MHFGKIWIKSSFRWVNARKKLLTHWSYVFLAQMHQFVKWFPGLSCHQTISSHDACDHKGQPGGRFKNTYELLSLRALKISHLYKNHNFQCKGKIFCVEFQRYSLKFHTKYLTHTLKDVDFVHRRKFKSSKFFYLISIFEMPPRTHCGCQLSM